MFGRDWRKSLLTKLQNYRTTPHHVTVETPAMMLMNREIHTKIPNVMTSQSYRGTKVKETDTRAEEQAKEYADRKRRAEEKYFKVKERVLLRQPHKNKYSTPFCIDPFTVIKINGFQLEIQDKHGQTYKRNSAHVKKYHESAEEREREREGWEEIEQPTTKEKTQRHHQLEEESTPHPTKANLYLSSHPREKEQTGITKPP